MPLLNGQAFAASKKTAKHKGLKVTQAKTTETAGEYVVTAKWKKAKKTTYKVVVKDSTGAKVASKGKKGKTTFAGKVGEKYTVKVKAKAKGKKWSKWAKKSYKVKDYRAELKSVSISTKAGAKQIVVGDTLTAAVDPADAPATYQWYLVSATGLETPITGATAATYTVDAAAIGSKVKVEASISGSTTYKDGKVSALTNVAVSEKDSDKLVIADTDYAVVGETITLTKDTSDSIVVTWYVNNQPVQSAIDALSYTPTKKDAGKFIQVEVKDTTNTARTQHLLGVYVAEKNIASDYKVVLESEGKEISGDVAEGQWIHAVIKGLNNDVLDMTPAQKANLTFAWKVDGKVVEVEDPDDPDWIKVRKDYVGKEIVVTVTSKTTSTEATYAGTLTASTKTGSETVAWGYVYGANDNWNDDEYALLYAGEVATAKVFGTAETNMSKTANLTWKYGARGEGAGAGIEWGEAVSSGTNNNTLTVKKEYFADYDYVGVFATVNGKEECLDYGILDSAYVTDIALIDEEGNAPTVGKAIKTVLLSDDFELTEAVEGTDYTVQYYAAKAYADFEELYKDDNKVNSIDKALNSDQATYGAKLVALKTSGKTFMDWYGEDVYAYPTEAKYSMTATLSATRNGEAVEAEPYAVGDELTVKTDLPANTEGLSYQWIRDTLAISGEDDPTYEVTKDDVGHMLKVIVKKDGYNDAEAGTTQAIVASADLTVKLSDNMKTENLKVGDAVSVEYIKGNDTPIKTATITWKTNGGTTLKTVTNAKEDTLYIPAAAYNDRLVVTVEAAGYGTYSFTTAAVKAADSTTHPYDVTITASEDVDGLVPAGATLTAVPYLVGDPEKTPDANAAESYQWYEVVDPYEEVPELEAINGETKATFTLDKSDYGKDFAVKVTMKEECAGETIQGDLYAVATRDDAETECWMLSEYLLYPDDAAINEDEDLYLATGTTMGLDKLDVVFYDQHHQVYTADYVLENAESDDEDYVTVDPDSGVIEANVDTEEEFVKVTYTFLIAGRYVDASVNVCVMDPYLYFDVDDEDVIAKGDPITVKVFPENADIDANDILWEQTRSITDQTATWAQRFANNDTSSPHRGFTLTTGTTWQAGQNQNWNVNYIRATATVSGKTITTEPSLMAWDSVHSGWVLY